MSPAVFLDRDGTLMEDREYLSDPSGVRVFAYASAALAKLRAAGYRLVVITNQSGIGRGWMTEEQYSAVNRAFLEQLGSPGIEAVYHCPAGPAAAGEAEHPDRKPNPGMFLRAAKDLGIDLSRSWSVGDSSRDLVAGLRAGCRGGVLVRTGKPTPADVPSEWLVVTDVAEAADAIIARTN